MVRVIFNDAFIMLTFAKEIVSNLAKYFNSGDYRIQYFFWKAASFGGLRLFQIPLTISNVQGPRKEIEIIVKFDTVLSSLSFKTRILADT